MIVPGYVRAAGWALVAGALCLLAFFAALLMLDSTDSDPRWYYSMVFLLIGTLLVAAGTLVVREQLGPSMGPAGRVVLLAGVAASLLLFTGFSDIVWELGMPWGVLPFMGPALLLSSLAVFGILSLRSRAVPPSLAWNLVAGFWLLLLFLASIVAEALGQPFSESGVWRVPGLIGSALTSIALIRLGFVLISGRQELPAAA